MELDLSLPFEKRLAWNLQVLQRKDAAVQRIVASASFVSLYEFQSAEAKWKKRDCEGCLFVVRRNAAPVFQLIVLNKMCPEDHLTELGDVEVNDTYLMMSTPTGIQGFWFYDRQERELVTLQILRALDEMAGAGGAGPPIPYHAAPLLAEEFEEATRPRFVQQVGVDENERERFKQALIKLIQTDENFVDTLYNEFMNQVAE
jgi:mRNA-decapping enzyme 1B